MKLLDGIINTLETSALDLAVKYHENKDLIEKLLKLNNKKHLDKLDINKSNKLLIINVNLLLAKHYYILSTDPLNTDKNSKLFDSFNDIYELTSDKYIRAYILTVNSFILYDKNQYNKAMYFANCALYEIKSKIKNKPNAFIGYIYNQIALILIETNQSSESMGFLKQAEDIYKLLEQDKDKIDNENQDETINSLIESLLSATLGGLYFSILKTSSKFILDKSNKALIVQDRAKALRCSNRAFRAFELCLLESPSNNKFEKCNIVSMLVEAYLNQIKSSPNNHDLYNKLPSIINIANSTYIEYKEIFANTLFNPIFIKLVIAYIECLALNLKNNSHEVYNIVTMYIDKNNNLSSFITKLIDREKILNIYNQSIECNSSNMKCPTSDCIDYNLNTSGQDLSDLFCDIKDRNLVTYRL